LPGLLLSWLLLSWLLLRWLCAVSTLLCWRGLNGVLFRCADFAPHGPEDSCKKEVEQAKEGEL
jgi:hypothetical protein